MALEFFRPVRDFVGLPTDEDFEQAFQQSQQNSIFPQGGSLLDRFRGAQSSNGTVDFSSLTRTQRDLARATAFEQFIDPRLSQQQIDASAAVRKNRIARGLRGAAADAAQTATQERFLSGNRRAALGFIADDLSANQALVQQALGRPAVLSTGERATSATSTLGAEDVLDFLSQAQAFRFLSQLDTAHRGGGRGIDISGSAADVLQASFAGQSDRSISQAFDNNDRSGFFNSLFSNVLGFQETRANFERRAAADPAFAEQVGTDFFDRLIDTTRSSLAADPRVGDNAGGFGAFADLFGLDRQQFGNLIGVSRTDAPGGQLGLAGRARSGESRLEGLDRLIGQQGFTLSDLRNREAMAQRALETGRIESSQLFLTGQGDLAARNQAVEGDPARQLATTELEALRSRIGQLEQIRNTLFAPIF